MALNFPDSPTDGQIYEGFYWDNTAGVWQQISSSDLTLAADFSNTATGTYTDGFDYKVVIFKADGTLTITRGGYADVLLVAGGGAGAGFAYAGGGGGAGGMIEFSNLFLPAGNHNVIVGAGGIAVSPEPGTTIGRRYAEVVTGRGKDSFLGSYVAVGGGSGDGSYSGHPGGSSGGGGYQTNSSVVTPPITGQGNSGGTAGGYSGSPYPGGGGGGAGAAGSDATSTTSPGNGGAGKTSTIITSAIATSAGVGEVSGSDVYFAGGGAGGARGGESGTGGIGGGAAFRGDAAANTGGGGAGNNSNNGNIPGNGGSGVVIVRVKV